MSLLGRRALETLNARNTPPPHQGKNSSLLLVLLGTPNGKGVGKLGQRRHPALLFIAISPPSSAPTGKPRCKQGSEGDQSPELAPASTPRFLSLSLSLSASPTKSLKQIQRENCRPTIRGKEGPSTISPWEPAQGGGAMLGFGGGSRNAAGRRIFPICAISKSMRGRQNSATPKSRRPREEPSAMPRAAAALQISPTRQCPPK